MDELPLFCWRAPAKLAIFPSSRNKAKILRTAAAAAASKNPENTIRAFIDRARASLQRKQLPSELIVRDVTELEDVLRTQVAALTGKRGVAK